MNKIIGILSGSGPEAGLHLCHCIHKHLQEKYSAVLDTDYIPYILYNKPLLGFDETGIADIEEVTKQFVSAIQELHNMGATHIAIACNTLHLLLHKLDPKDQGTVCNMIYATVQKCHMQGRKNVLILGSRTSRDSNLYGSYCAMMGIGCTHISNQEQIKIDAIIARVMGSTHIDEDSDFIYGLIRQYSDVKGIDGCILGCTELPLAIKHTSISTPIFDANHILAEYIVSIYKAM